MKKNKEIWLNLGSGVWLADLPFINVDNFFDLNDLKEGMRSKKGTYQNARVTKNTRFIKADIGHLPFPNDYADYIECNDVIEHQPMALVSKVLGEMHRVLKPGKKLCLSTPNFDELARLWTANITGNKFLTQEDWNRYNTLSQVIYGNQAGAGEFHKVPFNPQTMGYYLRMAGFSTDKIVITIYPTNCKERPPQRAYDGFKRDWSKSVILTEMMWVEATK